MPKGRWFVPAMICMWLAQGSPAQAIPPWQGERPAAEQPASTPEPAPKPESDQVPEPYAPVAEMPRTAVVDFVPAPPTSVPKKAATSRRPLMKNWVFWTFSATLLVLTIGVAVAVTESPPAPYPGTVGTVVF